MVEDVARLHAALEQQGVLLDQRIVDSAQQAEPRLALPPIWGAQAIKMAGVLLAQDCERSLLTHGGPVALEKLPQDGISQALGAMVNASLVPLDDRQTFGQPDFVGAQEGLESCSYAERGFAIAFRAARFFARTHLEQELDYEDNGVRVVVDIDGTPIFMQKAANQIESAITLKTVYIDGIPYPPGSMVGLSLGGTFARELPRGVQVVPVRNVLDVSFLRSTFFLVPPKDRPKDLWGHHLGAPKQELTVLRKTSIEDVARVSQRAANIVRSRSKNPLWKALGLPVSMAAEFRD